MSITIDVDLRERLDAARDQGKRPTCLVFAVSAAHEVKRGASDYLSSEYLFYAGAQRMKTDPTGGISRSVVREALMHDGQPLESDWPYQGTPPAIATWKPPASVKTTYKATIDFAKRTVAEVRVLVKSGTPVTLHIMATEAIYMPDADGVVRPPKRDKPTARHALLAVGSGHDDQGEYLLVRNSWGTTWGRAGHAWLHDLYLAPQLELTGAIT